MVCRTLHMCTRTHVHTHTHTHTHTPIWIGQLQRVTEILKENQTFKCCYATLDLNTSWLYFNSISSLQCLCLSSFCHLSIWFIWITYKQDYKCSQTKTECAWRTKSTSLFSWNIPLSINEYPTKTTKRYSNKIALCWPLCVKTGNQACVCMCFLCHSFCHIQTKCGE